MDIKDLSKRKRAMEEEIRWFIAESLSKFTKETGLVVSSIEIASSTLIVRDIPKETVILGVKCEVAL